MKIVIDISDEGYDWIKNGFPDNEDKEFLIKAIKNGTVIAPTREPENAKVGELIDAYTKGFDAGVEIQKSKNLQGEYTEEDIKQAIKENFDLGYEMAKKKYERQRGEWRPKTDFDGFTYCVCSSCNWLNYGDELNFCPNCGADMKGEQNE